MEKKIAEEKARMEAERAENEAKMKKLAEKKARQEGKRADNETRKKLINNLRLKLPEGPTT